MAFEKTWLNWKWRRFRSITSEALQDYNYKNPICLDDLDCVDWFTTGSVDIGHTPEWRQVLLLYVSEHQ